MVALALAEGMALEPGYSPVTVDSVQVVVPRALVVSESFGYRPRGDILWRGDPPGDRYEQVERLVQDALVVGAAPLDGPRHVALKVTIERFHALTERARATVGGVHSIIMRLAIVDPETGLPIVPERRIQADLVAYGGTLAMIAEARGETQKVRISAHLAEVIRQELTMADGYPGVRLGMVQVLSLQ